MLAALREFTNQLGNLAYTPKTDNKKRQQTIIQHQHYHSLWSTKEKKKAKSILMNQIRKYKIYLTHSISFLKLTIIGTSILIMIPLVTDSND